MVMARGTMHYTYARNERTIPLCVNSGTHLYPESTTQITWIEATGLQLEPETYIECP